MAGVGAALGRKGREGEPERSQWKLGTNVETHDTRAEEESVGLGHGEGVMWNRYKRREAVELS